MLKRAKKGSTVIHSDGALGIKAALEKGSRLKHRSVTHTHMEFARRIQPAVPGGSTLSGTQAIDSTWKTLNKCIPGQLNTKKCHGMNPLVEDYAWSWVNRLNNRNKDGFMTLGSHIAKTF